jgi:hypothetical protein
VLRVFGGIALPGSYATLVILSAVCWSAAFAVYAALYWPVLSRRQDRWQARIVFGALRNRYEGWGLAPKRGRGRSPPPNASTAACRCRRQAHCWQRRARTSASSAARAARRFRGSIADLGLHDYYRLRDASPPRLEQQAADPAAFDEPSIAARYVTSAGDGVVEARLLVEGMRCAACAWLIEQTLRRIAGVESVSVRFAARRLTRALAPRQRTAAAR